jgi:hypothetical protein
VAERKMEGDFIPAHAINPEVPPVLDGILARMLARNPRDRFQTASELIVHLERSNLAASLPSFVELSQALADPLMRARLTAPSGATQPDLERVSRKQVPAANAACWYLRFRDAQGQWAKSKGTLQQIIGHFREDRLPKNVQASRQPQGEYKPLLEIPEFREAIEAADSQARLGSIEPKRIRVRRYLRIASPSGSFPFLPGSFWVAVAVLLLAAAGVGVFLVLNL